MMTENELKDLLDRLGKYKSDVTGEKLKEAVQISKEARNAIDELRKSGVDVDDYELKLEKLNRRIGISFKNLRSETQQTSSVFDSFFGNIEEGLNANAEGIGGLTQNALKLGDVFLDLGTNLKFWRDYDRRIREVGVSYGLTQNRIEEFRSSNKLLESEFVAAGFSAEEFYEGIQGLYSVTERTDLITKDFADSLAGISVALGVGTGEAGKLLGSFRNLNISYGESAKLLNDVRNAAISAGLNTKKVLDVLTDNFTKLNTYSFKNGTQGMTDMVKQSMALKVNMDAVLKLSDDFTDPEKTMEFASNMQMLGGSFSQLGDFNKLMYDAAVAPEELAKNIAKATASMGSFNKETGRLEINFAERMQLGEAAKQLGMSREDMVKMATAAAKINDLKMSLNFKPLSEDAYNTLSTLSEFDPSRGEYVVKFKDERGEEIVKSVAELNEEDIKKIAEIKDTESLKLLTVQKLDVLDISSAKLAAAQYTSPDTFKVMGGLSDELKNSVKEFEDSLIKQLRVVKTEVFEPTEEFFGKLVSKELKGVFDGVTDAINTLTLYTKEFIKTVKESETFQVVKKEADKLVTPTSTTKLPETKSMGAILYGEKYEEGNILKGLSHDQGGIPFTVGGKPGFEAEGGEVLLTKGVSEDPNLLKLASKINEAAGGKKLFADGGMIPKDTDKSMSKVFDTRLTDNLNYDILSKSIQNLTNEIKEKDYTRPFRVLPETDRINLSSIKTDYNINKDIDSTKISNVFEDNKIFENFSNQTKEMSQNIMNDVKEITNKNETQYSISNLKNLLNQQNVTNQNEMQNQYSISNLKSFINQQNINNKELTQPIGINPMRSIEKEQGGLVKNPDIGVSNISLNGLVNVAGNVTFSPIKVSIDGTNATKEITVSDNIQKEILKVVEDKIGNMNLYAQFLSKKNTLMPERKEYDMVGITSNIS